MALIFTVEGSSGSEYTVQFEKRGDHLSARCDCAAGMVGQHCKHRLALLRGDGKNIRSGNSSDLNHLLEWLRGTDLERAIGAIDEAEAEEAAIKKKLANLKKALARIMSE